jgi:hypothetical protein
MYFMAGRSSVAFLIAGASRLPLPAALAGRLRDANGNEAVEVSR